MLNEIIVNSHPSEQRIAVVEDSKLVELFVEKRQHQNIVGNIYKGTVKDVLPGMGAAFIDIGLERTAFLHYEDIVVDFLDSFEQEGSRSPSIGKDSSKIKDVLSPGQEIIVQIQKGPLGKKGARLTGQISIPGKFLVFFPNKNKIAISRKINSPQEKSRIKGILNGIKDENCGLIVRTDAEGCAEEEFIQEYNGIYKTWKMVEKQISIAKPPSCIYEENNLLNTLIRDLFSSKVDRLVIDDKNLRNEVVNRLTESCPELCDRVELYQEDSPIFDAHGIEKEIEKIFHSRIYLPCGGNIVIEQTEALVAIDINTGSFTGHKNYQETVKKINMEAAVEIARQVRLRDLSGIVIIDFVDMALEKNKQEVLDTLRKAFRRDRARNKVFPFGPLGLVEVTRKRTRESLILAFSEHCPHCHGSGKVLSSHSVVMKIHRWLHRADYFIKNKPLKLVVAPQVKDLIEKDRDFFKFTKCPVSIGVDPDMSPAVFKVFLNGEDITGKYNP